MLFSTSGYVRQSGVKSVPLIETANRSVVQRGTAMSRRGRPSAARRTSWWESREFAVGCGHARRQAKAFASHCRTHLWMVGSRKVAPATPAKFRLRTVLNGRRRGTRLGLDDPRQIPSYCSRSADQDRKATLSRFRESPLSRPILRQLWCPQNLCAIWLPLCLAYARSRVSMCPDSAQRAANYRELF